MFTDGDAAGRVQVVGIWIRRRGRQDGGIQADPQVQRDIGKLNRFIKSCPAPIQIGTTEGYLGINILSENS